MAVGRNDSSYELFPCRKQCQVEGQDYSSKYKIWALQNFIPTIVIKVFWGKKKVVKALFKFFWVKFVVLGCFSAWFKGKNSQKVRKKIVKISEKNPLLNKHFLRLPLWSFKPNTFERYAW